MNKSVIFFLAIVLLAIPACSLFDTHPDRDFSDWPRYRVSMEYDYGDIAYKATHTCTKPQTRYPFRSIQYYCILDTLRGPKDTICYDSSPFSLVRYEFKNEKGGTTIVLNDGTIITRNAYLKMNLYHSDSVYVECFFSRENAFRYYQEYSQDLGVPSGVNERIQADYIKTNYISRSKKLYEHKALSNIRFLFLPSMSDSLAFSFQFEGECLDEGSLPDSIIVKVRGTIDIYQDYFESKEYTDYYPHYSGVLN